MKRAIAFAVLILWPATAAADVTPAPTGLLSSDGWIVVGSMALGLILAGVVWKVRSRSSQDADSSENTGL